MFKITKILLNLFPVNVCDQIVDYLYYDKHKLFTVSIKQKIENLKHFLERKAFWETSSYQVMVLNKNSQCYIPFRMLRYHLHLSYRILCLCNMRSEIRRDNIRSLLARKHGESPEMMICYEIDRSIRMFKLCIMEMQ
jgi:hypothetical protein